MRKTIALLAGISLLALPLSAFADTITYYFDGHNGITNNNSAWDDPTYAFMIVGNFTGSPTSVACNVFGPITGI